MSDARKKPCCICRRWFRPDPRIGLRQRACRKPDCQIARRRKKQKKWRERHPDYFIARRILDRGKADRPPEPLRLPPPLSRLPWDIAQSQFEAYLTDSARLSGTLPLAPAQSQMPTVAPSGCGESGHEAGVSPTGP